MSLECFFDGWSVEYDDAIERCVPRYGEMLWAILYYTPDALAPRSIVELGPGSGNLTARLADAHPRASFRLVDLSREMLDRCAARLDNAVRSQSTFDHASFLDVELAAESVDLVTSSIALHHLPDADKQTLFARIATWLRPGGAFVYSDQFAGVDEATYRKHVDAWRASARSKGTTDDEWATWMQHQDDHDHHASLPDQIAWLDAAGFAPIDCVWRHLLWTVVVAQRPSRTES